MADFEIGEEQLVLLEQVIGRHVPYHGKIYNKYGELHDSDSDRDPFSDEAWANQIMISSFSQTGMFASWNVEDEEAKLDDLLRTARKLSDIFYSVHFHIRCRMIGFDVSSGTLGHSGRRISLPALRVNRPDEIETEEEYFSRNINIIEELPELIERRIKVGKDEIRKSNPPGRTDWLGVHLIMMCRLIWSQRTGKAPKSLNPASRFGKFAKEVFDVVGIKEDPRSAMNAWRREVHS